MTAPIPDSSTGQPRVAVVTGGSHGLGAEVVREFSLQGWRVAACARSLPSGDPTGPVWTLPLNVTQRGEVATVFKDILDRWGRIDALVNNAGVTANAPLARMTDEAWQEVLDVNLRGAFLCSQAAVRPMVRQRDGHILNIASFSGRAGAVGQANYSAAKAALLGLTQSLAAETGSRNVRVNAILPGVMPTAMTAGLPADSLAAFASANLLGRLNDPAEVARFIVFLAGLRNVSGQVFQLDSRPARWT